MAINITIASGEIADGKIWKAGESISVSAGGTLSNSEITAAANSLTLNANSVVSGALNVGASVTVNGTINAADADIIWNISDRKEEAGLLWSNLASSSAKSYSIMVDSNQNKGTYRIAGNAANFNQPITIVNESGVSLGSLSISNNVLDFDITRYTLAVNDAGELTLNVASNISDEDKFVFLY